MHFTAFKVNEKRETVVVVKYIFLNDITVEEKKMIQYHRFFSKGLLQ